MNRLGNQTSPYLLQHKDNPVHWQAWGPDALEQAKRENKPILLSVGYAACHWCHVMAHESFEDHATADVMNDAFVNIKVDREERPDIDAIYQRALMLMGRQGGWPLTMFLLPNGDPFYGGTYFPPEPRYGMPAFTQVLSGIAQAYHDNGGAVQRDGEKLKVALASMNDRAAPAPSAWDPDRTTAGAETLARYIDPINGGFGQAPKFPQPPLLDLLLHGAQRSGNGEHIEAVRFTLEKMTRGGIYDHLGGGYARYAVDEEWLAPHFEKMLYDNAQILPLLARLHALTGDAMLSQAADDTVAWLAREMFAESGAFAATQDADSEGEEGKFYVWSETEIDALLGPDAKRFKQVYDVTKLGNWEGKVILNRLYSEAKPEEEDALAAQRAVLFEVREKRIPPGRDDKVLADWNGLMIDGLTRAGLILGHPAWITMAERTFDAAVAVLSGPQPGTLVHAFRAGKQTDASVLEDYGAMALAALSLYQATGKTGYLDHAVAWTETALARFWDEAAGGFFMTPAGSDDLITRPKSAEDNVTPSGNGLMGLVLASLHHLTGDALWADKAEALFAAFDLGGQDAVQAHPVLLRARDLFNDPVQLVVVGPETDRRSFLQIFAASAPPTALLLPVDPDTALPDGHPAHGKNLVEGKAAAYLCRGRTCSAPVTDAGELKGMLQEA